MRFFDASALVKRYVRESGTKRVRSLLDSGIVAVSRLSEIEVISAFARLSRERAITERQRDRLATAFVRDLSTWNTVEMTPQVASAARALLLRHTLRAGDAIQLAAAITLQNALDQPIEMFVAADDRLVTAAKAENLPTLIP